MTVTTSTLSDIRTLGANYHTLGVVYSTGDIVAVVGDLHKVSSKAPEQVYTALNNRPGELGYVSLARPKSVPCGLT